MRFTLLASPLFFIALSIASYGDDIQNRRYFVEKFTNYSPRDGGINGSCGKSASGYDACKFFLEDHLEGRAEAVMIAVPQKGEASKLFGGIYEGTALQNGLNRQRINVFAGDRYGKGSNFKSKADVCTKKAVSDYSAVINRTQGELKLVKRAPNLPWAKRKLARSIGATAPLPPVQGFE